MKIKLYLQSGSGYGVVIVEGNSISEVIEEYRKIGRKIIGYQIMG